MLYQLQKNNHTCLVTSFANLVNMPVATLIEAVGHDGTEKKYNDDHPEVGHTDIEIINAIETLFPHYFVRLCTRNVEKKMAKYSGVIAYRVAANYMHAVTWIPITKATSDPELLPFVSKGLDGIYWDPKRGFRETLNGVPKYFYYIQVTLA